MYVIDGLGGAEPSAEFVTSFPFESIETGECGLPVRIGKYWVQTIGFSGSLIVLDMSIPKAPVPVDTLDLGPNANPHWVSLEPGGTRILLTGYDSLEGTVYIVHIDPQSGKLTLDEQFRTPGSDRPGITFLRQEWPHGPTGSAIPHGAVFSRD